MFIYFSNTGEMGNGVSLTLHADPGNPLCVVSLFNRLRRMDPLRFAASQAQGCERVFRLQNGLVLHKFHVQKLLKASASRFGFKPKDFTSHSLR